MSITQFAPGSRLEIGYLLRTMHVGLKRVRHFDSNSRQVVHLVRVVIAYDPAPRKQRLINTTARDKEVVIRKLDTGDILLLEEGHCLRDHAIAACGPRRGGWEAKVEATSLPTLIQMIEGGLGVTLLPEIALKAGLLKGTRLIARPFAPPAPSRTLALVARRTSPRLRDVELLAEFFLEQRRHGGKPGIPALRRSAPKAG